MESVLLHTGIPANVSMFNTGKSNLDFIDLDIILSGAMKLDDSTIYLLTDDPENNSYVHSNQLHEQFQINTEIFFTLRNNPDEFNKEGIIELLETKEVSRIEIPIFDEDVYQATSGIRIAKGIVLDFNVVPGIEDPLLGYKRCLYLHYDNLIDDLSDIVKREHTIYCFKEDDYDTLFTVLNSLFTPTPILHHYEVSDVTDNNESELFKYLDSHIK